MDELAVRTPLMPGLEPPHYFSRRLYQRKFGTVMDGAGLMPRPNAIARPTAAIVQEFAGQRPTAAVPADSGSMLRRLPARNLVRASDPSGAAIAGATVRVYRGSFEPGSLFSYPIVWPDRFVAEYMTESDGAVDLGPQPFTDVLDGALLPDQMAIILRFEKEGWITYAYLDPIEFALARARGETSWEVPLTLELKAP